MDTGLGFVDPLFFIGVVENREDPRAEGRVQVRAFGAHGSNRDVPTEDLPWATLIIGSHDVNFNVPPLNAWVFGLFIDGRDAQQPMIMGLIPTQATALVDPQATGWGAIPAENYDRQSQGSRPKDLGLSPMSKLATGEFLNETYNHALESNRVKDIAIGGGRIKNHTSVGNGNAWGSDTGETSDAFVAATLDSSTQQKIAALDNDDNFQSALSALTRKHGVTREQVYGIISGESSYNPAVINRFGYAGFFQFGQSALDDINARNGTAYTPQRIAAMSPTDQLKVYDRYLDRWNFKNSSGLGVMQAAPAFASRSGDTEVYKVGSAAWKNNRGWRGADGRITVDSINGYYNRKNPPKNGGTEADSAQTAESNNPPPYSGYVDDIQESQSEISTWEEPSSAYGAQYPYNRVIETASGHSIEMDDTPGAERIMIWHQNGSYIQIAPTSTTNKNTSDTYNIHERNHHVYIRGNNLVTIDGDAHVLVKGNKVEEIQGDYKQIVHGNIMIGSGGKIELNGADRTDIRSASLGLDSNVENINIKTSKNIVLESGESINIKSKNVRIGGDWTSIVGAKGTYVESEGSIHVKSDENLFLSPNKNLFLNSDDGIVSVQSKGTVKINSDASIAINSASYIGINAKANVMVDSGTTTNINSDGLLSLRSTGTFVNSGSGDINVKSDGQVKISGSNDVHITGPVVYIDDIVQLASSNGEAAVTKQPIVAPTTDFDIGGEGASSAARPSQATTVGEDGIPQPPTRSIPSPDKSRF